MGRKNSWKQWQQWDIHIITMLEGTNNPFLLLHQHWLCFLVSWATPLVRVQSFAAQCPGFPRHTPAPEDKQSGNNMKQQYESRATEATAGGTIKDSQSYKHIRTYFWTCHMCPKDALFTSVWSQHATMWSGNRKYQGPCCNPCPVHAGVWSTRAGRWESPGTVDKSLAASGP